MTEELPCHTVLEDGGHGSVEELKLALWVQSMLGHGFEEHARVRPKPATRFEGERDKLGVVVLETLGHSRTAAGQSVAARVGCDLTGSAGQWAAYHDVHKHALCAVVEDQVHPAATNLTCDVRAQLGEDLFELRSWVHPPLGKRGNAVG